MNAHRQFEKLIPLYLYDELDAGQSSQLQTHIDACETCTKQLAELQSLHEHLNKKNGFGTYRTDAWASEITTAKQASGGANLGVA